MAPPRRVDTRAWAKPRLKPLCAFVLGGLGTWSDLSYGQASVQMARVEFDPVFLGNGAGGAPIDLSRFEQGNVTSPGTYRVDLYAGPHRMGRYDVSFQAVPGARNAQPYLDERLLRRIGVDFSKMDAAVAQRVVVRGEIVRIDEAVPGASADFDFGEQRLTLSVPQASLAHTARGYVSPEQWDSGVTVGMLGYNLNVYRAKGKGSAADTQGYLSLNSGVNLGDWHLRHSGSYSWATRGSGRYQSISTYVQRDLPRISSQLVIGEAYTSGELFDATQFRGVRIASDDRMLPDSLRGYAPVVRGTARTNAKVTIRQNGVTLYETTVAPGPFEINDLYPTGYGGDLQVSVTEADGSVHQFSLPYAAVPLLLRAGQNRYSLVAGAVHMQQGSSSPLFGQGTWQRGVNNTLPAYGGMTFAQGYAAAMAGGAFNTAFGALGADVTYARTAVPNGTHMGGSSMRVNYARSIAATNTSIALAAYRYSTSGYFGLDDAMLMREGFRNTGSVDTVWRARNRASVTLSQRLGEIGGQVSVMASTANYWNRGGSNVNYSVSYSNAFRRFSYSVSATRQRDIDGKASTLLYAGVTIPLGNASGPLTVSGNLSRDTSGQTQLQSTLSGSRGEDGRLSYSVTANHASGADRSSTNGSGNVTFRSQFAELNASLGMSASYQQGSLGIRGAVVAHPGGVTFSLPLSETFGIVKAPGAAGARVISAPGVRVNSRGYAVVPYLTPYSMNTVELDPKGLSLDVELKETSQQVAPRAGAAALLQFPTSVGLAALIQASHANGTPLPFGALVYDGNGKRIGVVGQAGKLFVRGLSTAGTLTVKWGANERDRCVIPYELPAAQKAGNGRTPGYRHFKGVCRTTVPVQSAMVKR